MPMVVNWETGERGSSAQEPMLVASTAEEGSCCYSSFDPGLEGSSRSDRTMDLDSRTAGGSSCASATVPACMLVRLAGSVRLLRDESEGSAGRIATDL